MNHSKTPATNFLYHITNPENARFIVKEGLTMRPLSERRANEKEGYSQMFHGESLEKINAAFFWDTENTAIDQISLFLPQALLSVEKIRLIDLGVEFSYDFCWTLENPVDNVTMVHSKNLNVLPGKLFNIVNHRIDKSTSWSQVVSP